MDFAGLLLVLPGQYDKGLPERQLMDVLLAQPQLAGEKAYCWLSQEIALEAPAPVQRLQEPGPEPGLLLSSCNQRQKPSR